MKERQNGNTDEFDEFLEGVLTVALGGASGLFGIMDVLSASRLSERRC
jgi:hypothetical protein